MALTSEHQLVEFDAAEGKLSDWSRRNPKAYLPAEFRGVKDRAMGCLWDLSEEHDRLWLYGTSWLWMFDLNQDFPSPDEFADQEEEQQYPGKTGPGSASPSHKRKRSQQDPDENRPRAKKSNTGAGDRMTPSESAMFLGASKIRKIEGADDANAEWITLDDEPRLANGGDEGEDEDEYATDDAADDAAEANLAQLRRGDKPSVNGTVRDPADQTSLVQSANGNGNGNGAARRWWHTYKYRDILGIVPLSSTSTSISTSSESDDEDGEAGPGSSNFEVAVVERPMWDVELPGRYLRGYE